MKMKLNMKQFLIAGIAAYVGSLGFFALPKNADAYQIRRTATICEGQADDDDVSKYHGYYRNNSGSTQNVFCPIDTSTDMGLTDINTVNIHGSFSGGDARACRRAWNSASTWCGATAGYSTDMYGAHVSDLSGLAADGDFGYIHVALPGGKTINGYFITD